MKINRHTRISDVIRRDSRAIEAIASINPHFNKLRNPLLRKVLAPRVTLSDAAHIGGCEIQDLLNKLREIGFEIEEGTERQDSLEETGKQDLIPQVIRARKVQTIDVRPILEGGVDPFQAIMGKLKTLPYGYALEVVNSFEPAPLIKLLDKKGYASRVEKEGGVVRTWFLQVVELGEQAPPRSQQVEVSLKELEERKGAFTGLFRETDVRDLEMPLPMVTILNELEVLPEGHALFVHHKKVPQYLLPELEERGYFVWIADLGEGNVKLLIHR